jgi:uncharacterized protein YbbC (DUF1343 family)
MRENRLSYNELFIVSNREVKMKLPRIFLIASVVSIAALLIVNPSFSQVTGEKTRTVSTVIDSVSRDFKHIIVAERIIVLSANTKVFDESGNILKISDLKPNLHVTMELLKNSDGMLAKTIMIKTRKGEVKTK